MTGRFKLQTAEQMQSQIRRQVRMIDQFTADQMRMFRKLKMRSVITETPSQYGTFRKGEKVRPYDHQRLAYYLYAALLWNPDADVKALMKDYCETAFAGAAAPTT